ncbi:MAG: alpha/beta hydrolase [Nevskiaceae bacterium]|nr:MAG: alpha/beta hydrolase [Nevskiaceae bacterium]
MKTTRPTPARLSLRAQVLRRVTRLLLRPVLSGDMPIPRQRARLAQISRLMGLIPLPRGTLVSQQPLGGVPTEWLENLHAGVQGYLLYLHGGAYAIGSPASHRNLTAHLAKRCGVRVAVPDYRLAPDHPFPAAVDDALAAYRALIDMGVAAQDIVIAGDSAGGGLTLACALAIRDAGLPLPAGLICLSPWTDLTGSGQSMTGNAATEAMLSHRATGVYAGAYLNGADPRTPLASPMYADLAGLPPLLIQVADAEILYNDATRLADAAQRAGVRTDLQVYANLWHVWQLYAGQMPEADDAVASMAQFVTARLGGA